MTQIGIPTGFPEPELRLAGKRVQAGSIGFLKKVMGRVHPDEIHDQFHRDGYLLVSQLLDRNLVTLARNSILTKLQKVDEIYCPAGLGIPTGRSRRAELSSLSEFWQAVSTSPAVAAIVTNSMLKKIVACVLSAPVIPHDYVFVRTKPEGPGAPPHRDDRYFSVDGCQLVTAWIPLGNIAPEGGAIYIVDKAHGASSVTSAAGDIRREVANTEPMDLLEQISDRREVILTASFEPGDVVLFNQWCLHGSFDNSLALGSIRLSCDVRYQPATAPRDHRFFGKSPTGLGGGGYGEMLCAQPLPSQLRRFGLEDQ